MKANCSYCNQEFEISDPDFLMLFKRQQKIYCLKCRNKKTMGCYRCIHFTRFYDYDYCSGFRSEVAYDLPIYCDLYIPLSTGLCEDCDFMIIREKPYRFIEEDIYCKKRQINLNLRIKTIRSCNEFKPKKEGI